MRIPGSLPLIAGALAAVLAGCGQKGPLYRPEEAPSAETREPEGNGPGESPEPAESPASE